MSASQLFEPLAHRGRWKAQAGMSLLELLFSTGLVMVVLALAFPIVKGLAEARKEVDCAARLRSLSILIHSYTAENNHRLPAARIGMSVNSWFSIVAVGMNENGSYREPAPGRIPLRSLQCPSQKKGYSWVPWQNVGYTYNNTAAERSTLTNSAPSRTPLV